MHLIVKKQVINRLQVSAPVFKSLLNRFLDTLIQKKYFFDPEKIIFLMIKINIFYGDLTNILI